MIPTLQMKKLSRRQVKSLAEASTASTSVTETYVLNFFCSLLPPSAKGLQLRHSTSYMTSHGAAVTIPCVHMVLAALPGHLAI